MVMPKAIKTLIVVPSFSIPSGGADAELESWGWLELYW